jgi:phage antirepressor protein|nr:MAG TPA: repressor domain protein [Caudoviricetes sp.]
MELIPFTYGDSSLRVVEIDSQPWFVAKDVCDILGLGNMHSSLAALDEDERGLHTMDTPSGTQEMTIISEPGLYSLILRSRKPEAKTFKRWVTHEVLPSIRKHGVYATESVVDAMLADPEAMIRTLTTLKEERAKRAQLEKQVEADAPKVVFADAVASAKTDILIGDLAKILRGNGVDTGQRRLFEWMRTNGYLIRQKGSSWNIPTQKAMDMGLFRVKETVVTYADGHTTVNRTTKVMGRGQTYFVNKFLARVAEN